MTDEHPEAIDRNAPGPPAQPTSVTDEQAAVIQLPSTARTMVLAGPGTGKTHTLLRRAALLVAENGLQASEILVLSFTRAVVRELRLRDRSGAMPARILPETFDSFASRLLRENATEPRWEQRGFDGRIEAATEIVRRGEAAGTLSAVRHVLVDEAQDLVGVRADFVGALLDAHDGGWTAFGDPAQAIYDHEVGPDAAAAQSLIERLGGVADGLLSLTANHRAKNGMSEVARRLREQLVDGRAEAARDVWDAYRDLDTAGDVDELAAQLRGSAGSFAILCRDNATALECSDALHRSAVAHRVRPRATDRPVAGWLGAVLRARSTLTRDSVGEVTSALKDAGFPGLPDAGDAWRLLARMDRNSRGGAVRVSEVASRMSVGRVPWELYDEPEHPVTVSSIHRAKGLEFDRCAIAEWSPPRDSDELLESRVLYVALTRARTDCFHMAREGRRRWFRQPRAQDRFVKLGREKWQTFGIEVRGDDVDGSLPGGSFAIEARPEEIQSRLIVDVRPGDEVQLEYAGEYRFTTSDLPLYIALHAVGPVGVTSESFGRALSSRLGSSRRPRGITNVRIADLETVKGSSDASEAAGLGRSGLWLRPRLVGLGEFDWS